MDGHGQGTHESRFVLLALVLGPGCRGAFRRCVNQRIVVGGRGILVLPVCPII